MEPDLSHNYYDLTTPDGVITKLALTDDGCLEAEVVIDNISPHFVGFSIDKNRIFFNIKSTVAQVGLDSTCLDLVLDKTRLRAEVKIRISTIGELGREMLAYIQIGAYIGKLFAADERRRVRDPQYLSRMFGRSDRQGRPLLSLGGMQGSNDLILDVVDGRTVAYLALAKGRIIYDPSIHGFLPTIGKALTKDISTRELLHLHQRLDLGLPRNADKDTLLLVKTPPLHIRTVFARVIPELLSPGLVHTSASVLQPDTTASGDIYELYGDSKREITDIPLEFYTLEPYREYVFFNDRDQLKSCLDNETSLFNAFDTAPTPKAKHAAVFVVKGQQLLHLNTDDWIARDPHFHDFPGLIQGTRQAAMVERYIEQQPSYPFLKAISNGIITSQGILLTRFFPSPLMKRFLLSDQVQRGLKGLYFQYPSASHNGFFSAEDRALLHDLEKFAIPVYWVDNIGGKILQFTQKPDRDSGMFVPRDKIDTFYKATLFGVYGSNLLVGNFEKELFSLMEQTLAMRQEMSHPLLNPAIPLALVTGGGPGAMEMGNRVAKNLDILSCANIVDFGQGESAVINEQKQNPYIEAKMTYRLDKLVERQAEFNLDFPIFVTGGIGTDFEFALEEVRRKVGSIAPTPILLFGEESYWSAKITARYKKNLETKTIVGSEWVSNCFYCVQTAEQGAAIYRDYFQNRLPIGPAYPPAPNGFFVKL